MLEKKFKNKELGIKLYILVSSLFFKPFFVPFLN